MCRPALHHRKTAGLQRNRVVSIHFHSHLAANDDRLLLRGMEMPPETKAGTRVSSSTVTVANF
jgi:hypothetical protein